MRIAYASLGVHQNSVDVHGHPWNYLESGSAANRPMILLHGFGTSREAVMSMMPWFADTHHCVAPDLPGFGRHPFHEGEVHDADFLVRQVIAFADAVGATQFDLLGTSMGGALAVRLAATHPDRVHRMVLLAPAGVRAARSNAFMERVNRGENPLDIASEEDFERMIDLVFDRRPLMSWQFRAYLTQQAIAHRPNTLKIAETLKPFLLNGLENDLGRVKAPTLIVWGDRDRVTDISMLKVFLKGIPDSSGMTIHSAGHVVFHDQPDFTRRAIVPFLTP